MSKYVYPYEEMPLEDRILSELGSCTHLERNQLADNLQEPRTTVFDTLKRLELKGHVFRVEPKEPNTFRKTRKTGGKKGRPKIRWALTRVFEEGKI